MKYNEKSHTRNAFFISIVGTMEQMSHLIWTFVYRTVFLWFLSKEYLGINGLFLNILELLSLAELGIGSSILYRMYKPFSERNEEKISAYINFYKKVYRILFVIVTAMGLLLSPFIKFIVDTSEVPADVNIMLVYFLFLAQSASSYLFVYKQSVVRADQRSYQISIFTMLKDLAINFVRIVFLIITGNYELVLFVGIVVQILLNGLYSFFITCKYKSIFQKRETLNKEEKRDIMKDTTGLLCHKIGSVVLSSTDSIILAKICGLVSVGLYSNYSIIVNAVTEFVNKFLGNFAPVVGNYALKSSKENIYEMYVKLEFANLWIAGFTTTCLYVLLNPFIKIWLNDSFLLDDAVVLVICLQHYLKASWLITSTMIEGCGLFAKDKIRPLIESVLNLMISIVLAYYYGIIGVFLGTVISGACTYYWRGPYLLFKHIFQDKPYKFLKNRAAWLIITVIGCVFFSRLQLYFQDNLIHFLLMASIVVLGTNLFYYCIMRKTPYCVFFIELVKNKLFSKIRR